MTMPRPAAPAPVIVFVALLMAAASGWLGYRLAEPDPARPKPALPAGCDEALLAADQLALGTGQLSDGLNGSRYANTATQANYLRQIGQITDRYNSARLRCP